MKTIVLSLLVLLFSAPSYATLGEVAPQTQAKTSNLHSLTVRASQLETGTTVKEFTNSSGVVVAVTWQGPTIPNLTQLLGTKNFHAYASAPKPPSTGHRHALYQSADLVVESHGHLRAFQGKAYLPKLLPADVSADQIQ